jgi:ABC-type transporter Mla subunit MlaD
MEFQEENVGNIAARESASADRIAEDISALGEKAKSNITDAAETAKDHARRIAHQQKDAGADRLGEVAGAVHGAARTLEAGMPKVANYVHEAATQLEGVAKTLRHRSVDDLIEEIGGFARAQPAIFFGGAMLAGFALTRFLKSSGQRVGEGWQADPGGQ